MQDVAKFTLECIPSQMLENFTDVDFGVYFKNGDDAEFIPWTEKPFIKRGMYRYSNIPRVPCLDTHIQIYAKNNEGISFFGIDDFDSVTEGSNLEEIIKSTFSVAAPTNTRLYQNHKNVAVYWEPSQCATAYQVFFWNGDSHESYVNTTMKNVEITNLKECEQYFISVSASIGDHMVSRKAHVGVVNTPPFVKASDKIDPIIAPSANGVAVKWDRHTLPCVKLYDVILCHEDGHCEKPIQVPVDYSNYYVMYNSPDNLDDCSKYSVVIKPLHRDESIRVKHIDFHTLCPAMKNV